MKRYGTGLVVGKFAPLHVGHQLVIDTALSKCDHVVIVSWSVPEYPGCAPRTRAAWLAELYPQTTRLVVDRAWLEAWSKRSGRHAPGLPHDTDPDSDHRRFVGWLCTEVLDVTVDAVFTSESYGPGFAAELECWFGETGRSSVVTHESVDPRRGALPISATALRKPIPQSSSQWLPPPVAASFVRRVTLLGGESSGKSTLAAALAAEFGTGWVPEYGRELWEQRNGELFYDDLLSIAVEQVRRERAAARTTGVLAAGVLVCDTSPLTTLLYCLDMFGRAEPELVDLAARPYDLVVLCAPDFGFVQDGTRRDDDFRRRQHDWYLRELERRSITALIAAGPVEERVAAVSTALSGLSR